MLSQGFSFLLRFGGIGGLVGDMDIFGTWPCGRIQCSESGSDHGQDAQDDHEHEYFLHLEVFLDGDGPHQEDRRDEAE